MMERLGGSSGFLDAFKAVLADLVSFTEQYLKNGTVDEDLVEKLKAVASAVHRGSGSPTYLGWYFSLYPTDRDAFLQEPEVASMFTAVDDVRGAGGIVHLGTGKPQMMYTLVEDPKTHEEKIMMGPVYTSYVFTTTYGDRLNDTDWEKRYQFQKPIRF
jgi:hypothetical protein